MTDHRRLQRTLFRMQLDPGFAERVFARDAEALESTDLGAKDLELLLAVDPRAVSADFGGRRRAQVLGNVISEFELSLASASLVELEEDLIEAFPRCEYFHWAMRSEKPLPMAFWIHVGVVLKRAGCPPLPYGVHELETDMAGLRRWNVKRAAPDPDEVVLAPTSRLVRLPAGTFDWAVALRSAREAGSSTVPEPERPLDPGRVERVLLVARDQGPHRLAKIESELLKEPASGLLRRCEQPLAAKSRARYARKVGAEPADLERFVDGLVDDGVLLRG